MTDKRILVAGVGNIFLGDDAFGVEVAQRLVRRPPREGVRIIDFGIRGFDLAYALLDGDDAAILIDALPRGGQPGTLYVIEPDLDDIDVHDGAGLAVETHGMDPVKVLRLVKTMGGEPKRVLVVGCEPATLDPDEDGRIGLSGPVMGAVEEAIVLVESLVEKILADVPIVAGADAGT